MKENKRRRFIKEVGVSAAAVGVAGLAGVLGPRNGQAALPNEAAKPGGPTSKTIEWKMVTTWPSHFPILGEGADNFSKWVDEMSGGRLKIRVYGGGEIVPPLGVFDAVSQGSAEMGHGAAYYWAGKSPATQFFASVPFGFNAQSLNAWLYSGGGMELWDKVYARFNLKPFLAGNTGVQMGGWFNKEINSMDDFNGLKMRIPGMGGKVLAKAGGNAVLVAGDEICTSLARGDIDATEWVGPFHDLEMGLHNVAKYYYYPGWHECGTGIEAMVNLVAWNRLPDDLKAIVEAAGYKCNMWMLSEFEARNNSALQELINTHKVCLKPFPEPVLKGLKELALEVMAEAAASTSASREAYDAFIKFQAAMFDWNKIAEGHYQAFKFL